MAPNVELTSDDNDPTDDTGSPRRRPAPRHDGVRVEQIETVPMTPEQYQRAVSALATLINEWTHSAENRGEPGEQNA
ncbi:MULTISPECIES: hypothetical protein [Nocardia]|uniref:hypothetical protein n=1 Tax=Nocardia TaxID=1817 RepID=UPI0007E97F4E|nr:MULTISPECIES: hypothetical protein [Nocardia]MBF6277307.1 hypothetical protein [Nocardia nova]OBA51114.1 hypothetical protein A5789_27980 [Nocardia sp. 852002-51101_SCH5132738]OBB52144.1 hypothetical protein A5748_15810 [Nocardia sp. 852002-51244_SCH5132740]OBF72661.1 hypothetical protein A9X06_28090 [Mycobacterium sp. 852002-51759_SCH5129042]